MAVAKITNTIIRAANIAIPKSSGCAMKHSHPWWNKECQLAKKNQKKLGGFSEDILKSAEIHKKNHGKITYQI